MAILVCFFTVYTAFKPVIQTEIWLISNNKPNLDAAKQNSVNIQDNSSTLSGAYLRVLLKNPWNGLIHRHSVVTILMSMSLDNCRFITKKSAKQGKSK